MSIPDTVWSKIQQDAFTPRSYQGKSDERSFQASPAHGGDINHSYILTMGDQRCFAKLNRGQLDDFFTAEAAGLREIHAAGAIRCPKVIGTGEAGGWQYILLEFLAFGRVGDSAALGQSLAQLHRRNWTENGSARYGLALNNYIGSTPQYNRPSSRWLDFWISARMEPQLKLAHEHGFRSELVALEAKLMDAIAVLLREHQPASSLVHGDLWGGNKGFDEHGAPLIFDPAAYYGDREVDIAMTELFGGFTADFYRGYNQEWPLDSGYEKRKTIYNLYHQLNHLNLFGSGYLSSCVAAIRQIISAAAA